VTPSPATQAPLTRTKPASVPETRPVEPTTPILPSEAIRLGCLIAPVQGDWWFDNQGRACANGAMAIGFGWDPESKRHALDFIYPVSDPLGNVFGCPEQGTATCAGSHPLYEAIWHLNDTHEWSRERIAAYLESRGL
jgi:hypothetical protein